MGLYVSRLPRVPAHGGCGRASVPWTEASEPSSQTAFSRRRLGIRQHVETVHSSQFLHNGTGWPSRHGIVLCTHSNTFFPIQTSDLLARSTALPSLSFHSDKDAYPPVTPLRHCPHHTSVRNFSPIPVHLPSLMASRLPSLVVLHRALKACSAQDLAVCN